ncbi:hypothetical protein F4805DRAFT_23210 [Annulohypoxylon moriforme]|nr:hypothetical protein F4805DRAFT_23210 [Annulohypoxylon moriforme]
MKPTMLLVYVFLIISLQSATAGDLGKSYPQDRASGLQTIHEIANASVDIVAVHGLDGDWKESWTSNNGVYWIKDLLPVETPQSRILSYAYDSRWSADTLLTDDVFTFGETLVRDLTELRLATNTSQRPIIFIAHSLGGIVIKTALEYSDTTRVDFHEQHRNIILSTSAVLFMGTPHQGSEAIDGIRFCAKAISPWKNTNNALLEHLRTHSGVLNLIQSRYNAFQKEIETYYFYESLPMHFHAGLSILIAPKHTAVVDGTPYAEAIKMDADHSTIVKFDGLNDPNFGRVISPLRRLSTSSTMKIQKRWMRWLAEKEISAGRSEISEVLPVPQEFIIGSKINKLRNQKFINRSHLIDKVNAHLMDRKDEERKVLVLYGPGGVGKTQLVLEYTYLKVNDYTAIIWLDSTSKDSLIKSIFEVLRELKLHYEYLGIHKENYFYRTFATAVVNNTKPIETLHRWLSDEKNRHWLIIMDNVDDLESFNHRDFLPTINWGNIVITSRRTRLQIEYDAIPVEPMSQEEALKLLEEKSKLEIKQSSPEYNNALMLLCDLGHFPLAVAQAGSFIAMECMTDLAPIRRYREILANVHRGGLETPLDSPIAHIINYDKGSLFTTWEISFESIQRQNVDAVYILFRIGFLDRNIITETFFTCGSDFAISKENFQIAIRLLISYSLVDLSEYVSRKETRRCYTVHPLVQSWAIGQLNSEERLRMLQEVAIMAYKLKLSESKYSEECHNGKGSLRIHLDAIFAHCERYFGSVPELLPPPEVNSLSSPFKEAYDWYLWLHAIVEEETIYAYRWAYGTQTTGLQTWEIVYALRQEMHIKGQTRVLAWAVSQAMNKYSHRHPRVLHIAGDYAHALYEHDCFFNAENWFLWLLDSRRDVLGGDHPATMGALMGLGKVLVEGDLKYDCDSAIPLLKKAVEVRASQLGPFDFLTLNAKRVLGYIVQKCAEHLRTKTLVARMKKKLALEKLALKQLPAPTPREI